MSDQFAERLGILRQQKRLSLTELGQQVELHFVEKQIQLIAAR